MKKRGNKDEKDNYPKDIDICNLRVFIDECDSGLCE